MAHLEDTTLPLAHRSNTDADGHWAARLEALNALRDVKMGEGYTAAGAADYAIAHLDSLLEAQAQEAAQLKAAKQDSARARAAAKAAYHLAGGLDIRTAPDGAALVPSGTRGGVIHRVAAGQCSCEAGQAGRSCWHVEAVAQHLAQPEPTPPAPLVFRPAQVRQLLASVKAQRLANAA